MERSVPYLRLLFWLKLKLTWRSYIRNASAAFGAALLVLVFAPIAVTVGMGSYVGFTELARPDNEHLLRAIMLGIYLMWAASPILGYALTEEYDISKLLLYPLTARQLLAGATLGSVIDFGVMLVAPALLAALIAFSSSPVAFAFVAVGLALFLCHTLTLTQAIRLASAGVMRSRRARDLLLLLIPLVSIVFYVTVQMLGRNMARFDWHRALSSQVWAAINYLPPGLTARGVGAAGRGAYGLAAGFLVVMLAVCTGTLALAAWLTQRMYTGDATASPERRRHRATPPVPVERALAPTSLEARLPPAVAAVAAKEFKHLRRDPYYKYALMQSLYILAVIVFSSFGTSRGGPGAMMAASAVLWVALSGLLFMESQLAFNSFGVEGTAATTLFLFPSSRRHILIGKNIALFLTLSVANGIVVIAGAVLLRQLALLPQLFIWAELALVILIAGGNLSSIWFPAPIILKRGIPRPKVSFSASHIILGGLLFLATGFIGLPVLAAAVVPSYWVSRLWLLVTLPLAAVYVAFAYMLSVHLAEGLLLRREVELIEKLKPED